MLSRLPWWPSSQPSPIVRDQADVHVSCVFCHHWGMERGSWRAKPRQSKATSQNAIVTSDSVVLKNEKALPIAQSRMREPAASKHDTANRPCLLSLPSSVSQCSFALMRSPRQSTAKMKAHWAHSFLRLQSITPCTPFHMERIWSYQKDRQTDGLTDWVGSYNFLQEHATRDLTSFYLLKTRPPSSGSACWESNLSHAGFWATLNMQGLWLWFSGQALAWWLWVRPWIASLAPKPT